MNGEQAATNTVRMVIYVDGGIVQDVLADGSSVESMIVDYDNENAGEPKSSRSFEPVPANREYMEKTIQGMKTDGTPTP